MASTHKIFSACLSLALMATAARAQEPDIEGSKDHPLVKRYQGSAIKGYDAKEFDELEIPTGKATEGKFTKVQRVAGKTTTINYANPEKRSVVEVYRNYEQALKAAGFVSLFTCANEACGSGGPEEPLSSSTWYSSYGQRHLTAKLARPEGDVYVSLHVQGQNDVQTWTYLRVIETKPMESGLVTVDAMALAGDITRTGHVAVYGIYFDTGKADIKPESEPTLKEIAKLLQQNPTLKLHVVGHTDNVGNLAANMDLSRRRANAVLQALTTQYGVVTGRLRADGVGPLAPVASNKTEEGRAKNRRVELVEQ